MIQSHRPTSQFSEWRRGVRRFRFVRLVSAAIADGIVRQNTSASG
jgi:hypothetical protein